MKINDYLKEKTKTLTSEEREERYKYLGKEVVNVGEPGLDSIAEFMALLTRFGMIGKMDISTQRQP
jgi:hypothetical protein